jgi:hypothetical protein
MKYVSLVLRVDRILAVGSVESLSLCKGPAVIEKLRNIAIYGGRVVERSVLYRTI